jgi:protein-tyrosine-phosphatase
MVAGIVAALLLVVCAAPPTRAESPVSQVLFVCEHGNVKSLMAASYFNQLAQERGLPFRGVSRGSAPDSTTVPPPIVAGLRADGFDVSAFHPTAVSAADVAASRQVVTISTVLPATAKVAGAPVEQWTDVPAASVDYSAARDSLKVHVEKLIEQLTQPNAN